MNTHSSVTKGSRKLTKTLLDADKGKPANFRFKMADSFEQRLRAKVGRNILKATTCHEYNHTTSIQHFQTEYLHLNDGEENFKVEQETKRS